jgi:hypothetical protein
MAVVRQVITREFLDRVRTEGTLAQAARRLSASAEKMYEPLTMMSTWELVCDSDPLAVRKIVKISK